MRNRVARIFSCFFSDGVVNIFLSNLIIKKKKIENEDEIVTKYKYV